MRQERIQLGQDVAARLTGSDYLFFVTYKGLKVKDVDSFKKQLAPLGAECHVLKNRFINKMAELNGLTAVGYGADPEKVVIHRENVARLEERIQNDLSPLEKQDLDLHMTGMNYIEIAHILNRDEKSTDNALQRIRAKVRSWREGGDR